MKLANGIVHIGASITMGWGLWHWGGWPGLCLCLGCNVATLFFGLMLKETMP